MQKEAARAAFFFLIAKDFDRQGRQGETTARTTKDEGYEVERTAGKSLRVPSCLSWLMRLMRFVASLAVK
jgi:hypothetical protein